ncbi:succinate dehydrogenase iron-sulfur subunit [Algisphaera agarilytica]|uniref:succinate dehydrogenase n=1 Tax=Algisphaera agarilytica TaxID=1385975 RepID=A0A7X0LL33_9BACT|nr:succinate dehydrogenase iron-sulfur subunit [Algisphaera agarilytica]MBB6431085.1 succinate dehydrogenase / fumarate reductase iron-sulfur subunit [Algisphaera agarilytica]
MIAPNPDQKFLVRVKRQDGESQPAYWQEFEVPVRPSQNVISVLQYIAANPTTTDGKDVEPVVWDAGCLEEVCGACTMVINGRARQSCSALVPELLAEANGGPITLEPMTKFPVVRDLFVDRQRMFDNLIKVKGWVPIDGTHSLGAGPTESPEKQEERYAISRCMTCGCCLEACPQFTKDNDFLGAQAIAQAYYFNEHETGKKLKKERLDVLMGPGGVSDCGNAQNCVQVCPKEIPLTEAIGKAGRQLTVHAVKKFFTGS